MKAVRMIAAGAAALCAVSLGQGVDPYDEQLTVYWLDAQQRGQFSTSDLAVSPFWASAWVGRDSIDMIPSSNANPDAAAFVGDDDATIVIKAAADCAGIYLYCGVSDNTWVDRANADDFGADAVDLYLDRVSASDIATCSNCYIGLYNTTLTYGTQQFQVWMGASALPTSLQYQAYDNNLWTWSAQTYTFAELRGITGIEVEVLAVDAVHKVQEWFIPWRSVGNGGLSEVPAAGARIALSGGYNDKDGDNPLPGELRWLGKDPWAADAQQVQYWGDLVMADGFVAGAPCGSGVRSSTANAARRVPSGGHQMQTYLLDGREVRAQRAGSTVVARTADGANVLEYSPLRAASR